MSLLVGNTYYIELRGGTATQGYNQFEAFISFPNTIFQILSVSTTYSANSNPGHVPIPNPSLYADACTWDSDPNSPTYRSCIGGDDKAGGTDVRTLYQVKIISGGGTSQTLNTLLYDFSGSSFHYNSDFSSGSRIANIIGPSSVTINKLFSPKAISPGGMSVMTIKLTNPTTEQFTGVNFSDTFPSGMTLANTTSSNTCGGTLTDDSNGALNVGDPGIKLSGGTLSGNSVCTITANVTAPAGTYVNTTGNLFINTSIDTGNTAFDTLQVSTASACVPGQTLATWTFTGLSTVPDAPAPPFASKAGNVATALASTTTANPAIETNASYGNPAPSWSGQGFSGGAYFQFQVDTSKYSNVTVSFDHIQTNASWNVAAVTFSSSSDGITFPPGGSATLRASIGNSTFTTSAGSTYFRISATGSQNNNSRFAIDNVTFTGCLVPAPAPTITKSFLTNPIIKGATSTLRFTISNIAAGNVAQSGIAFTDVLPSGLSVSNATTSACNGINNLVTTASTQTISLTGGSLPAGGSCTFSVTVTGNTEGSYENVTGFLSSSESGTSTSYATSSLTVIAPPVLAKSFSPSSIFTGNTSTLTFTITNPNLGTALSGIGFSDTLVSGLTVASSGPATTCGGSLTTTAPSTITFAAGSLAANGNCTFSVTVTGTTAGTKNNTTTAVTSNEGGNGNTATASLVVNDQTASIDLTKQVSATGTDPWSTFIGVAAGSNVYYRFKVYNSGDLQFTSISVSDPVLTGTSADPATCNWTVSLPLAPGDTAYCIKGPVAASATPGSYQNTATAHGTYATGTVDSSSSTATYATPALTFTKSVTETYFVAAGNVLHYSFNVTNSGFVPLLGPVTVSDDKATDESCPAVSTVGDIDNYLDPGEAVTCTATYTVTAADMTAGFVTNTASATAGGVPSNTDSKRVNAASDLTVTKVNNTSNVAVLGTPFTWTLTVNNNGVGPASFANGQRILSDTLPGAAGYYPQGALTVTNGGTPPIGTINCSITGTALACIASGAVALPAGASFSITFNVASTIGGNLPNTATVDPDNSVVERNESNNTGLDTVNVLTPTPTPTDTPTQTPTNTPTNTPTDTPTSTPTNTPTDTPTPTNTPTDTPTATSTPTQTPTDTPTNTPTDTPTSTSTNTPTDTPTATQTPTQTLTETPTNTPTDTPTSTPTNTPTHTPTATDTPTQTPTDTPTNTPTITPTSTPTDTPTSTPTDTPTATSTSTPTNTPTSTPTTIPTTPVARDDSGTTSFNTPVTLSNITTNDSAFGPGNSILINTIDLDPSMSGQQTSFTDVNGNQWSVNTTTGEVTFAPTTNFTGIATIPYSVQDANGQTAAANLSVTVGLPASIQGTVFNDPDLNGTQGAGEAGIGSVRVDLYDSTGTTLIATVITTASGSYNFPNVTPGSYLIVETDLAGYVSTTPNSVPTTVGAGGSDTVNFGDYRLPNTTLSGILGMVFNDANGNGVQDSGETALSGVTVELKNNFGTVIAATTTDALGSYSFSNLAAGAYTVMETDPTGFTSTTLNNVAVNLSAGTTATINFGDQTSGTAQIADPAVTKFGSPANATVGSAVVYKLTVGNNGNVNATNVVLTDTKPSFLDLISITISPNPGLTPVVSGSTFTINFGTVAPADSYVVTVVTRVNSLGQPPGGSNHVSITTDSATDRSFNNAFSAALQITSGSGGSIKNVRSLPETGFAPGVVTDLSHTPRPEYLSTGDVTLEIPALGIKIPVVGVPLKDETWNVSWLGKQAGWLQGTAFPSWNGNSLLTSHVYLSNGLPGPFVNLRNLKFGDKVIIHAFGDKYTFEVQTNSILDPDDTTVFKHEEKPWLTLVTCREYDEKRNAYRKRVVVRAILVDVNPE